MSVLDIVGQYFSINYSYSVLVFYTFGDSITLIRFQEIVKIVSSERSEIILLEMLCDRKK